MAQKNSPSIWYKMGLRRFLIFPSTQIKYAVILTSTSVMGLLAVIITQELFFEDVFMMAADLSDITNFKSTLRIVNFSIIIFSTCVTAFATILVTHRFMGPIFAIQRSIDNYNKTGNPTKIHIRENDELKPLVENLNKFFDSLKK